MISARSGSQRSHTSSSVNFATGSRNSPISQSCGSRRSLPRLSARRCALRRKIRCRGPLRRGQGRVWRLEARELVNIDLNSDAVLVRREVADVQLAKETLQNLINEGAPNPLRRSVTVERMDIAWCRRPTSLSCVTLVPTPHRVWARDIDHAAGCSSSRALRKKAITSSTARRVGWPGASIRSPVKTNAAPFPAPSCRRGWRHCRAAPCRRMRRRGLCAGFGNAMLGRSYLLRSDSRAVLGRRECAPARGRDQPAMSRAAGPVAGNPG